MKPSQSETWFAVQLLAEIVLMQAKFMVENGDNAIESVTYRCGRCDETHTMSKADAYEHVRVSALMIVAALNDDVAAMTELLDQLPQ